MEKRFTAANPKLVRCVQRPLLPAALLSACDSGAPSSRPVIGCRVRRVRPSCNAKLESGKLACSSAQASDVEDIARITGLPHRRPSCVIGDIRPEAAARGRRNSPRRSRPGLEPGCLRRHRAPACLDGLVGASPWHAPRRRRGWCGRPVAGQRQWWHRARPGLRGRATPAEERHLAFHREATERNPPYSRELSCGVVENDQRLMKCWLLMINHSSRVSTR